MTRKREGPENSGLIKYISGMLGRYVLDTPKSISEAAWRFLSLILVGALWPMILVGIENPKRLLSVFVPMAPTTLTQLAGTKESVRLQLRNLIEEFFFKYQPKRLALVARVSRVGVRLIWANEDATEWPTAVDGVMSSHMRPIEGHLLFDGCWSGELAGDPTDWLICGIRDKDSDSLVGHLIANWPEGLDVDNYRMAKELQILSDKIRSLLFS